MTTVTLTRDTGSSDRRHTASRAERKTITSTRAEEQGDYCPSANWAPQTTTDPQQQGKDHLPFPFLRQGQQPNHDSHKQHQRIPAEEQPFTVENNSSSGGDLPSWWGSKERPAAATAAAVARRAPSPFQSGGGGGGGAFQQQEQHAPSNSWSESPTRAGGGGGGGFAYVNNSNGGGQMMAKAGYMPFDNEDRLGIFDSKRGGFDQQQDSPAGSGVSIAPAAASSGLDAWPSTYSSEIGEPWVRQAEGGGQQGLRQVCSCVCVCAGLCVVFCADPSASKASVLCPQRRFTDKRFYFVCCFFFSDPVFRSQSPSFLAECVLISVCLVCQPRVCVYISSRFLVFCWQRIHHPPCLQLLAKEAYRLCFASLPLHFLLRLLPPPSCLLVVSLSFGKIQTGSWWRVRIPPTTEKKYFKEISRCSCARVASAALAPILREAR